MKIKTCALILLFLTFFSTNVFAGQDFSNFALIPIMHEGRIKPLGTFAQLKLKEIYGKSSIEKMSADEWMAEVFFNPQAAYERNIFKISNNDVKSALTLTVTKKYFSFIELYSAFNTNQKLLNEILTSKEDELDLTSKQLKELYAAFSDYLGLSRSFSFFSRELKISENLLISYYDLAQLPRPLTSKSVIKFKSFLEEDAQFKTLTIIPPTSEKNEAWTHPWLTLQEKNSDSKTLKHWHKLYLDYWKSSPEFAIDAQPLQNQNLLLKFKAELFSKKIDLVTYAISFYIFGFLILCLFFLKPNKIIKTISFLSVAAGGLFHLIFISIRCFILSRPPVTNLYESILFVGLTSVVFGLIFELKRKNSLGLFIASALGAALLFLSNGYQQNGDSLGMLVAVLDTNFWLATHVVTISIGYGCALVASLMAHFYLFKAKSMEAGPLNSLEKNLHGTILFSLFFVVLGTILGGIWADQSWGRFWGWDPKENGALLICLWLLWITHGRLAGKFKKTSYAFVGGITSIIVALAWFGVNLLNVGLHSYGFSNDAARSLLLFAVGELIVLTFFYIRAKQVIVR